MQKTILFAASFYSGVEFGVAFHRCAADPLVTSLLLQGSIARVKRKVRLARIRDILSLSSEAFFRGFRVLMIRKIVRTYILQALKTA